MTKSRFWHGFADMHTVAETKVVMRSGEGVWLEDIAGNRHLLRSDRHVRRGPARRSPPARRLHDPAVAR
jgi:hypothetical protein